MGGVKRIKDPVHGYIPVKNDFVKGIMDHRAFQRLRHLKQLSATNLVYPGANHTRFEHSLGVYHLAERALQSLRQDDDFCNGVDIDEIEYTTLSAALLHDIGHPPFSHIAEKVLDRQTLKDKLNSLGFTDRLDDAEIRSGISAKQPLENEGEHELLSCIIILEEFAEPLQDELSVEVDPHEVCSHIFGLSIKGESEDIWQRRVAADLISSPMDIDRLDYITRDNFMTGADVANVDTQRMVSSYKTCNESLVLSDKALSTIGNYLEGRIAVYMWINQHHKSVFANALLREMITGLDEQMDGELISTDRILNGHIDDNYVMETLRNWSNENSGTRISELYHNYMNRNFPKSCWKHRLAYESKLGRSTAKDFDESVNTNQNQIETELIRELDVASESLWLETSYIPSYQPSDLRKIQIEYEEEKETVTDIGLYEEQEYVGPTPYIFTYNNNVDEILTLIQDAFSD